MLGGVLGGSIVAASIGTATPAHADPVVIERVRLFAGYLTDYRPRPLPRTYDPYIGAAPGLNVSYQSSNVLLSGDYTLSGALHSESGASELANLAVLAAGIDLSKRTQLLLSLSGTQSTLSNFLVNSPTTAATPPGSVGTTNPQAITVFPPAANRFVSGRFFQGLRHELSQRLTLAQGAEISSTTTLAPTPPLDTFLLGASGSIDYLWPKDSAGVVVNSTYGLTYSLPPTPDQRYLAVAVTPQWRHDWSPSLSSTLAAGGSMVVDVANGTDPLFAPSGRASVLYTWYPTTFEISAQTGYLPSFLTGQITQTNQGLVRVATPISMHHQVLLGSSISYAKTTILALAPGAPETSFDAVFSDVDVTWQALPLVQVFARYQFLAQIGERNLGVNPSFLRDTVFAGVLITSRPPVRGGSGGNVNLSFPNRVDGNDNTAGRTDVLDERARQRREVEEEEGGRGGEQRDPNAQQQGGPSRWIYVTPARPPQNED